MDLSLSEARILLIGNIEKTFRMGIECPSSTRRFPEDDMVSHTAKIDRRRATVLKWSSHAPSVTAVTCPIFAPQPAAVRPSFARRNPWQ